MMAAAGERAENLLRRMWATQGMMESVKRREEEVGSGAGEAMSRESCVVFFLSRVLF